MSSEIKSYRKKDIDTIMYIIGWVSLGLFLLISGLIYILDFSFPPCILREHLGIYCPGCGATRALIFLLQGNILKSLLYHPIVLYCIIIYGVFMSSHTLSKISSGRVKGTKYRSIYIIMVPIILVLSFIIKNFFLLVLDIQLIP